MPTPHHSNVEMSINNLRDRVRSIPDHHVNKGPIQRAINMASEAHWNSTMDHQAGQTRSAARNLGAAADHLRQAHVLHMEHMGLSNGHVADVARRVEGGENVSPERMVGAAKTDEAHTAIAGSLARPVQSAMNSAVSYAKETGLVK